MRWPTWPRLTTMAAGGNLKCCASPRQAPSAIGGDLPCATNLPAVVAEVCYAVFHNMAIGDTMHKMVSWLDLNYRMVMLILMAYEVIMLTVLVVVEVAK